MTAPVQVLVVDIGGTGVKIQASGQTERRKFPSGKGLTPSKMVAGVKDLAKDWQWDVVSIGYPGIVREGRPAAEPRNLARGWIGFDFQAAFGRPVKMINDAAMQALGSYRGGTMLFLGLGTGLGSALVADGTVVPLELGQGRTEWQKRVEAVTERFVSALLLDDVVLGGGNAKRMTKLPQGCRLGDNANAYIGGFRLWEEAKKLERQAKSDTIPRSTGPAHSLGKDRG